jgi:hypothetical protein
MASKPSLTLFSKRSSVSDNPLRPNASDLPPEGDEEIAAYVAAYMESSPPLAPPSAPGPSSPPSLDGLGKPWELGEGRGGRKEMKTVLWEVIRPLKVPDDLPLLENPVPAPKQTLLQIRHTHHQLAQLIAQGTEQTECALITGYAPSYISVLKGDPSFNELISYYAAQQEVKFVDVIDRMRSLGLSTLEELQSRLELEPQSYSHRELMELAELTLVKPMAATRSRLLAEGSTSNGGVSVQVNFVKSEPSLPSVGSSVSEAGRSASITIEGEYSHE